MRHLSLRALLSLSCLTWALGSATPAAAQSFAAQASMAVAAPSTDAPFTVAASFDDQRNYRRPRGNAGPSRTAIRLFGAFDVEHMTAQQSFGATLGTATLFGFGAGVDFINLRDGLFIRAALSEMSKSGTRSDGSDFSNGIGLNVRMVPIDLAAGWRFNHLTPRDQMVPYVGGGAFLLHYSETTPSGNSTDDTVAWYPGFEAFAGVDLRMGSGLSIAPEVDFRSVPNAIGQGGVSQIFGETNLGGVAFRVTVGVTFGHR